jgi:hypothetical protein
MAEPWWSYLDEKEYRSRKASEFRVKAEDFFKQKRQPEVPAPEPEKEGGGGLLGGLKQLGGLAMKPFEWEREHIGEPAWKALTKIPTPFIGVGINEENAPGKTLLSVGPVDITAGFGKPKSEITEAIGPMVTSPSSYVGLGLAGKAAAKVPAVAKYAPGLAKLEDIAIGGPVFRGAGRLALKPFAAATRRFAPDIPKTAGIAAKMVDEKTLAEMNETVTKVANLLRTTTKPARVEQQAITSIERGVRAGAAEDIMRGELAATEGLEGPGLFAAAQTKLGGEFPKATYALPEEITSRDITNIYNKVAFSNIPFYDKMALKDGLNLMLGVRTEAGLVTETGVGRAPGIKAIARIEKFFGKPLADAARAKQTFGAKVGGALFEATALPRALLAAYDASAPLRQGMLMAGADFKSWRQGVGWGWKAMFNPEFADDAIRFLKESREIHPLAPELIEASGLHIGELGGVVGRTEEQMSSTVAQKFPLVQASERGYVVTLAKMRHGGLFNEINTLEKRIGRSLVAADLKDPLLMGQVESIGKMANALTGRGNLPDMLKKQQGILGTILFAPRLLWSRVEVPAKLMYDWKNPLSRQAWKMAAKGVAGAIAANVGVLGSMKLIGDATGQIDVEIDPRSTDFGKIRIGETRLDFFGGYQPIMRYGAQFIVGQRKTTVAGEIYPIGRFGVVKDFIRTKLSPIVGMGVDAVTGETMLGDPITGDIVGNESELTAYIDNHLTPMFIQDMKEALAESGPLGAFMALPGAFGASVMSYAYPSQKLDAIAQQEMNQRWKDLNPKERRQLMAKSPEAQKVYGEYIQMGVDRGQDWAIGLFESLQSHDEMEARINQMLSSGVPKASIAKEYDTFRESIAFTGDTEREPRDAEEALIMGYFAIKPKILADGSSDWDTYYDERNAYMEQNGKTQEYFNQNELLKWKSPEVKAFVQEYQTSRDLWSQYYEIPSKLGMDEEQLKEAKTIQGWITTAQFGQPGVSAKQILMQLPLSSSQKMLWLRYSRLPANPAREQFRRQYGAEMVLTKPPEFGGALPTGVTE